MLVLLIIFMVTAPMLNQGVEVDLPQANTKPLGNQQAEPLVLTVNRKGEYFLNKGDDSDKPLEAREVLIRAAAVLRNRKDTPVLVKGDKNVPYGDVVRAMALLQGTGAPKVGLMTDAPSYESPKITSASEAGN
jgi:biopolymer transport protein TolR